MTTTTQPEPSTSFLAEQDREFDVLPASATVSAEERRFRE